MQMTEAVWHRLAPFIAAALDEQPDEVRAVLAAALTAGPVVLDLAEENDLEGRPVLWLTMSVAGQPFVRVDARAVGLHPIAGEDVVYVPDPWEADE